MWKQTLAVFCITLGLSSALPFNPVSFSITNATASASSGGALALGGLWTDCGVAELVDISLTSCTNAPCPLNVGNSYDLRIQFRPRDQHWDMHMRSIIMKEAQLQELADAPVPDSTVNPGQLYEMNYNFNVPGGITGAAEFRMKVYQNYVHELCLVIPVNIS